jgi:pilus assembly protein TadC
VADAFGEPIAGVLGRCAGRHAMGATHADTFAELLEDAVLAPVGRVLLRSVESGGALTRSLVACAEQMRYERAGELERRARAVGVKAVAPLGLCFLPAFVLLAVVPIIGSMVQSLF